MLRDFPDEFKPMPAIGKGIEEIRVLRQAAPTG